MYDLAIVNGNVYFDKRYHKTNVYIKNGKIVNISPLLLRSNDVYDCEGNLVLPGIIDPHTHFQLSLGKITSRDDFLYGSKAAAYGGVTTIIDFLDPVDNASDLHDAFIKRCRHAKRSVVDYKLHACLKDPKGKINEITEKMSELGLNTVKIFTTYSESSRRTYDPEIIELLQASKAKDFLITAHVENDDMITLNRSYKYQDLSLSRPSKAETTEALKLASYVKATGGNFYMVHLSSGETLKQLKEQYPNILNKNFLVESCPHYFAFNNSKLLGSDGYLYTMAPPLRSQKEVDLLSTLIKDVYTIGTDHCSFNRNDKKHEFLNEMPLGIGGIEYSFDIMYQLFGDEIIDKMTLNVAKAHRLYPQKGIIAEGSDADLFIYELKDTFLVKNHGFTDHTLYKDMPVKGSVLTTISRGKFIVKNGMFINRKGKLLNQGGEKFVRD